MQASARICKHVYKCLCVCLCFLKVLRAGASISYFGNKPISGEKGEDRRLALSVADSDSCVLHYFPAYLRKLVAVYISK